MGEQGDRDPRPRELEAVCVSALSFFLSANHFLLGEQNGHLTIGAKNILAPMTCRPLVLCPHMSLYGNAKPGYL